MRNVPIVVVAVCLWIVASGCARSSAGVSERHAVPLYDLLVENRHDSVVTGFVQFGDVDSVAGGRIAPGEIGAGQHQDLTGGIPAKATMRMSVFPKGTTDFQHTPWTDHYAEVPVRSQLPHGFYDGVFYFIIQQDLSLRLVILTHEQWESMKAQGKRPE